MLLIHQQNMTFLLFVYLGIEKEKCVHSYEMGVQFPKLSLLESNTWLNSWIKNDRLISVVDLEARTGHKSDMRTIQGTLCRFKERLEEKSGTAEQIEKFCSALSLAYIPGVAKKFPNAKHTFDKFHIMKIINEAVDEVRRQEQKRYLS
jgi:transposase